MTSHEKAFIIFMLHHNRKIGEKKKHKLKKEEQLCSTVILVTSLSALAI